MGITISKIKSLRHIIWAAAIILILLLLSHYKNAPTVEFSQADYDAADIENAERDGQFALGKPVEVGKVLFLTDLDNRSKTRQGKLIVLVSKDDGKTVIGLMQMVFDSEKNYFVPTMLGPIESQSIDAFPPITPSIAQLRVKASVEDTCDAWTTDGILLVSQFDSGPVYEVYCESEKTTRYYVSALDGAIATHKMLIENQD